MAGTPAYTTYDVSRNIALFRAVVLAMTYTTTVLTDLIFIISQSSVQSSQLSQLIPLVVILSFRSRGCLEKA